MFSLIDSSGYRLLPSPCGMNATFGYSAAR